MRFILAHLARAGTDPGDVVDHQDRRGPAPLPVQRGSPAWTGRPTTAPHVGLAGPQARPAPCSPPVLGFCGGESGPGGLGWNPRGMPRACESSARGAGCPPGEAV